MTSEERLLARLANRVGMWHEKHEQTGDEKYARLAAEADALYRRALHHLGPCGQIVQHDGPTALTA